MSAVCFKKLHNRVVQKKASILSKKSDTERGNIEASVMWSRVPVVSPPQGTDCMHRGVKGSFRLTYIPLTDHK